MVQQEKNFRWQRGDGLPVRYLLPSHDVAMKPVTREERRVLFTMEKGSRREVNMTCRDRDLLEAIVWNQHSPKKGYRIVKYIEVIKR